MNINKIYNNRRKFVRPLVNSHIVHIDNNFNENNDFNKKKEMDEKERLKKIEDLVGTKAPKRKVKVEKKDKGIIERTETVLITEDNKMLLND